MRRVIFKFNCKVKKIVWYELRRLEQVSLKMLFAVFLMKKE